MKKMLILGVTAFLLIALSSCQFNLFAAFDRIEIPSAADLDSKAGSDPDGFVSDVEEYVETGSITEDNADDVADALKIAYSDEGATETGQRAAVMAGEIIITSDPVTSSVVNGVIGAVVNAKSSGTALDPDTLIAGIFPSDLDLTGLKAILDDLDEAALAYNDFAGTVSGAGTADWMSDTEVLDSSFFAVVSLAVSDIRAQVGNDDTLLAAIKNGTALGIDNPFDTGTAPVTSNEVAIGDILTFSNLTELGI